jgi:hypothetical protein
MVFGTFGQTLIAQWCIGISMVRRGWQPKEFRYRCICGENFTDRETLRRDDG